MKGFGVRERYENRRLDRVGRRGKDEREEEELKDMMRSRR